MKIGKVRYVVEKSPGVNWLKRQLYKKSLVFVEARRREVDKKIPRFKLGKENIKKCQVLLNRNELIAKIPKSAMIAEIGVDKGDFSELLLECCQPEKLYLIDTWGSERYGEEKASYVRRRFESNLKNSSVEIVRCDSISAARIFPDGYFDWIYIDTDHSYQTTISELHVWAPKVKKHGIIAGHDYEQGNWIRGVRYGVIEAVHEFCTKEGWELSYLTTEPTERRSFAISKIAEGVAGGY